MRQGWGLGLLWGQGCHQDGPGQGKGGTKKQRHVERGRKEAAQVSSVPCWAPATYHHLVAAYQRVIYPHSLEALFQAKAALQGGTLQTRGQRLYSTHPSDLSEHGSCHPDRRARDSTSLLPPESPPWPSSQGLQTLRTLAYDTDSPPVTSSVLSQFLTPELQETLSAP